MYATSTAFARLTDGHTAMMSDSIVACLPSDDVTLDVVATRTPRQGAPVGGGVVPCALVLVPFNERGEGRCRLR